MSAQLNPEAPAFDPTKLSGLKASTTVGAASGTSSSTFVPNPDAPAFRPNSAAPPFQPRPSVPLLGGFKLKREHVTGTTGGEPAREDGAASSGADDGAHFNGTNTPADTEWTPQPRGGTQGPSAPYAANPQVAPLQSYPQSLAQFSRPAPAKMGARGAMNGARAGSQMAQEPSTPVPSFNTSSGEGTRSTTPASGPTLSWQPPSRGGPPQRAPDVSVGRGVSTSSPAPAATPMPATSAQNLPSPPPAASGSMPPATSQSPSPPMPRSSSLQLQWMPPQHKFIPKPSSMQGMPPSTVAGERNAPLTPSPAAPPMTGTMAASQTQYGTSAPVAAAPGSFSVTPGSLQSTENELGASAGAPSAQPSYAAAPPTAFPVAPLPRGGAPSPALKNWIPPHQRMAMMGAKRMMKPPSDPATPAAVDAQPQTDAPATSPSAQSVPPAASASADAPAPHAENGANGRAEQPAATTKPVRAFKQPAAAIPPRISSAPMGKGPASTRPMPSFDMKKTMGGLPSRPPAPPASKAAALGKPPGLPIGGDGASKGVHADPTHLTPSREAPEPAPGNGNADNTPPLSQSSADANASSSAPAAQATAPPADSAAAAAQPRIQPIHSSPMSFTASSKIGLGGMVPHSHIKVWQPPQHTRLRGPTGAANVPAPPPSADESGQHSSIAAALEAAKPYVPKSWQPPARLPSATAKANPTPDDPIVVLVLGCRGAGKSTQAAAIASRYNLLAVSSGEWFREGKAPFEELRVVVRREFGPDGKRQYNGLVLDRFVVSSEYDAYYIQSALDEGSLPVPMAVWLRLDPAVGMGRAALRGGEEKNANDHWRFVEQRAQSSAADKIYAPIGALKSIDCEAHDAEGVTKLICTYIDEWFAVNRRTRRLPESSITQRNPMCTLIGRHEVFAKLTKQVHVAIGNVSGRTDSAPLSSIGGYVDRTYFAAGNRSKRSVLLTSHVTLKVDGQRFLVGKHKEHGFVGFPFFFQTCFDMSALFASLTFSDFSSRMRSQDKHDDNRALHEFEVLLDAELAVDAEGLITLHIIDFIYFYGALGKRLQFRERYKYLTDWFDDMKSNSSVAPASQYVVLKEYVPLAQLGELLPSMDDAPYAIDGIVFQGAGQYRYGLDKSLLKWKPQEMCTADFRLTKGFLRQSDGMWQFELLVSDSSEQNGLLESAFPLAVAEFTPVEVQLSNLRDSIIVELSLHSIEDNGPGAGKNNASRRRSTWHFHRIRPDKPTPNKLTIVKEIVELQHLNYADLLRLSKDLVTSSAK